MTVYEVVLQGKQADDDMLNVFHYNVPDGEIVDWQLGADEIRSHLANYIAPLSNLNVSYEGITVREDLPGAVGNTYLFTLGALAGGSPEGDALREASVFVRKRATNGVRPALGWFFVGGITVSGTGDEGSWAVNITDEVQLYADDIRILGAVSPSGANMVIKAGNPAATNTVAYNPVDTMQVINQPRTVRSRRGGKGS